MREGKICLSVITGFPEESSGDSSAVYAKVCEVFRISPVFYLLVKTIIAQVVSVVSIPSIRFARDQTLNAPFRFLVKLEAEVTIYRS